jgi:hypothetical protein
MIFRSLGYFIPAFAGNDFTPLAGGTITAYLAGTSRETTLYSDKYGTPIGSIVTLNARGEPEVSGNTVMLWADDSIDLKLVLKDATGSAIWTIDDIGVVGVGGNSGTVDGLTINETLQVDGTVSVGTNLNTLRPFRMGFTDWPYDDTPEAIEFTAEKINEHGDIVSQHLKEGIPWAEALANDAVYPAPVEANLDARVAATDPAKPVFLTIDSLTSNRATLIGDFGDAQSARAAPFDVLDFDSPDVITAYTNFALNVLSRFPSTTHFCYAAEASELFGQESTQPGQWNKFLVFAFNVYTNIRAVYPNLKIMITMVLESPDTTKSKEWAKQFFNISPATDVAGVSVYPYAFFTSTPNVQPSALPVNWLSQVTAIAPGKPVAIAETGWIAENLSMTVPYTITATSTPAIQNEYLAKLLTEATSMSAEFVVWWAVADYDDWWPALEPIAPLARVWRDIGLYNGNQVARVALATWDSYLARTPIGVQGKVTAHTADVEGAITAGALFARNTIGTGSLNAERSVHAKNVVIQETLTVDDIRTVYLNVLGQADFANLTAFGTVSATSVAAENVLADAMSALTDDTDGVMSADLMYAGTLTVDDGAGGGTATAALFTGTSVIVDGVSASVGVDSPSFGNALGDCAVTAPAGELLLSGDDGIGVTNAATMTLTGGVQIYAETGPISLLTAVGDTIIVSQGVIDVTGLTGIKLNLPTSAGASGTLWNDAGTVKVVP